jgi:hypothetical protein
MSGVFIPATSGVFDVESDRIEIGFQLRTQDNTYRSYSNFTEVKKTALENLAYTITTRISIKISRNLAGQPIPRLLIIHTFDNWD